MTLAIFGSNPPGVQNVGATNTTASFTPPAGSLIVVCWDGDSISGATPPTPTITDNLATPLTYRLSDWVEFGNAVPNGGVNGQAAIWTAVGTGAAMTISVTNNGAAPARESGLKVLVFTDSNGSTPRIGAHGKANSASATAISQSYTATATGGWGVLTMCDWDARGAPAVGTGCASEYSDTIAGAISMGTVRRTTADDVAGATNTLNITIGGAATSTNACWCYIEIVPALIWEDASQPAVVTTNASATITTGSFSPPAGSLLVAQYVPDSAPSTLVTGTVTDSLGGTWTLLKRANLNAALIGGAAEVWCRYLSSAPGAMTVSGTNSFGATGGGMLLVRVLNGAASVQNGATASIASATVVPTVAITATVVGSRVYASSLFWTSATTQVANGETTRTAEFLSSHATAYDAYKGQIDSASLTSTTYGFTNASGSYLMAAVEILPDLTGGATSVALAGTQSNPLHPGKGPGRFSGRRLQKPSNTLPLQASAVISFVPVGNTRRDTQQIPLARRPKPLAVPGGQATPSTVARRNIRLTVPVRRGRAVTPVSAQVVVPPAYVPDRARRDTQLVLYVRRGRGATPVPAQVVVPPAYVPDRAQRRTQLTGLSRRTNRVGHIPGHAFTPPTAGANARRDTQLVTYQRRGRGTVPPLAEVGTPASTRRPRSAWWAPRRGRAVTTPTQAAAPPPAYVLTPARQAGKAKILWQRRGRAITPTPTQAAAPPPAYVLTPSRQPGKAKILWQRRGHVTDVVIAQAAAPPPAYVLTPARPPGRRWAALRRGRASWVVPTQAAAPAPSWVPGMARRQMRIMLRRPARAGHLPGQGHAPMAPMGGATRRDTQLVLYVRRRPVSQPVPAQQAAPVGKFLANLVKRARLWLLPRRKQAVTVVQGGLSAPPGSAQFRSGDRGASMVLGDSGVRFTSASGGTGEVTFVDGSRAVEFKDGDTGTEMRSGP